MVTLAVLSLVVAVVASVHRRWRRPVRSARRHRLELVTTLPDLVDLLVLAAGAGSNVHGAVGVGAAHGPAGPAASLSRALDTHRRGTPLADALDAESSNEPALRPVLSVLTASLRYGTPLLPSLERVGVEARTARRLSAQDLARRVPVHLLFPLVGCILPAFALLTVVPLLAGTTTGLRP